MQKEERQSRINELIAKQQLFSEKEEIELLRLLEQEAKDETFAKLWDVLCESKLTMSAARKIVVKLQGKLEQHINGISF